MRARAMFGSIALAGLLFSASPASAAIVTFTNLAAWQAATTGASSITFEENTPPSSFTDHTPTATFSGITFSIPAGPGQLFTVDPAFGAFFAAIGTGDVLAAQQGATSLSIASLNVTALAFDYVVSPNQTFTITLSTGDVIPIAAADFVPGFFGVTSTTPITSLSIAFSQFLNIDNFATATAAVPEPASLLLLGTGLLSAAYARRRARQQ